MANDKIYTVRVTILDEQCIRSQV